MVIGFVTPNSVDIPLLVSVDETEARYSYTGLSKVTDRDRTATARSCTYMTAVMTALFGDRN